MRTKKRGADLSGLYVAQNQHVSLFPVVDLVGRPLLRDADSGIPRVFVRCDESFVIEALRLLQTDDSLKAYVDDLGSFGPAGFCSSWLIPFCHMRQFPAERPRLVVKPNRRGAAPDHFAFFQQTTNKQTNYRGDNEWPGQGAPVRLRA